MWTFLAVLLMFLLGIASGVGLLWELQRRDLFGMRMRLGDSVVGVVNALVDGRLDRAEGLLLRMLQQDKQNVSLNRALAAVYRRQGRYKKALARDRSIAVQEKIRPNVKAEAFYHLALDYQGLGKPRRALEALEEAVRLAPRNRRIASALVDLLAARQDWDRAYEVQARRSTPGDQVALARLAHFQVEMGQGRLAGRDHKGALGHFHKARELHPDGYAAQLLAGDTHLAAEQYDRAIAEWSDLTRQRPELFAALYPRFQDAFFNSGRFDELGEFLRAHLSDHGGDDPRPIVILARYLAKKQLTEESIRELKQALSLDPGFIEAHRELGLLLLSEQRSAEALERYRELLEALPGRTPAFRCQSCHAAQVELFWRCPACGAFESASPAVAKPPPPNRPTPPGAAVEDRFAELIPEPLPVRKVRPAN
jgi:lipopolysaccharide biosynthesis regulator YciM